MNTAEAHGAAEADVFIDAVDTKNRLKLAVRDEGRVQQNTAVVELLILRKQKTQRICAGQHNFHSAGGEHIREQRRALNKVLHQCYFVEKHIAEALFLQRLEIAVHISQCVSCCDLNESCFRKLCVAHLYEDLTDHGCFSRPAQTIENKHFILRLAVNIVMQLPEAFALAIFAYRGRKGTQCLASADIRCKGMCRDGRYGFLGQLLLQHLQFFFQCFSSLNLLPERIHLFCRNILLPALLVLCPAVIEIHIAVDRLLCDRPSRQLCNLLLQLCYMGLDFG